MGQNYSSVEGPVVEYVIDQRVRKEFPASELLPRTEREISEARGRAFDDRENERLGIVCAACHRYVYPKRAPSENVAVSYSHMGGEGLDCPYNNPRRKNLTQIDAMRYNGQKEGDDHVRMKELLVQSIEADNKAFHQSPSVERNWYGSRNPEKWRRPDVSAVYEAEGKPLKIAFEVQLSSTYLHVIAARRKFYLEENALLFWILKDAREINPRQYQNDLFFNNNSNLFIVDNETLAISKDLGEFHLRCLYLVPRLDDGRIVEGWGEEIVAFSDLTVERETQRVFYFDFDSEYEKVAGERQEHLRKTLEKDAKALFLSFWVQFHKEGWYASEQKYGQMLDAFSKIGISLPERPTKNFERFATLVMTAQAGERKLTGYSTLLEVANWGLDHAKPVLYYFYRVMTHYSRWEQLWDLDDEAARKKRNRGRKHIGWRKRQKNLYEKIVGKDPEYVRDESLIPIFQFLFPDIIGKDKKD